MDSDYTLISSRWEPSPKKNWLQFVVLKSYAFDPNLFIFHGCSSPSVSFYLFNPHLSVSIALSQIQRASWCNGRKVVSLTIKMTNDLNVDNVVN